ncbi:MAG TPA: hypothetical protein VGL72_31785 [Bryobacteraceae bacterium]
MRLLRLDDLMTSYTNGAPRSWLLVVDLHLSTASGLLDGSRNVVSHEFGTRPERVRDSRLSQSELSSA